MILALRHFGIVVEDVSKALTFYRDHLGLEIARQMDEEGDFIDTLLCQPQIRVTTIKLRAQKGETLLELLKFQHPAPPAVATKERELFASGPTHVALTVADIDSLYLKLKTAGVRFVSAPMISPDGQAKVCFCYDFEGNPVELVEELSLRE